MKTRKIENAPQPFQTELKRLKDAGILDSPKVKDAFIKAANALRDPAAPPIVKP